MSEQYCPEDGCEKRINEQGLHSHLHHKHDYSYDEAREIIANAKVDSESTTPPEKYDDERLREFYRTLREIREFEEAVDRLTDEGEVPGNPHLYLGQEAIAVGVCAALEKQDFVGSTWRGHGHLLAKGVDPTAMFLEIAAKETGLNGGRAGTMHMADLSVGAIGQNGIVGASASHVAGATLAAQLDGTDQVGVAFFSDGALNEGIVPETMNLAAIWDLPVVFVCENNQYAVSTSAEYAVANHESIPDRAEAMGIPGQTIDGQDVLRVYETAKDAVVRARNGEGPVFLECRTYRYSGHFSAEESLLGDQTYRSEEERQKWVDQDPVKNFAEKLVEANVLSIEERDAIDERISETLEDARQKAEESQQAPAERALENVYADGEYSNLPSEGYR